MSFGEKILAYREDILKTLSELVRNQAQGHRV